MQSNFLCEKCRTEYTYNYLFENGFCSVEDKEKYKQILKNVLQRYSEGAPICFSDWDYDFREKMTVTEQPALKRLCMMYPEDEDFKYFSKIYCMCRMVGRDYLNKLETGEAIVSRQLIVMPSCLRKVYLHDGVELIGEKAFMDCKCLFDIFLPDSVTKICKEAFCNSGIKSIHTSDNIKSIGEYAFAECTSLEKFFSRKI